MVDVIRVSSQGPSTPEKTYSFVDSENREILTVRIRAEGDEQVVEATLRRTLLRMKLVRGDDFVFEGRFREKRSWS